ncbi:MAG: YeeE/YedE family protein [Hyphomicrobium sp.]|nr:YeeE/YedE family protein [Hyphomicrobium sp.]
MTKTMTIVEFTPVPALAGGVLIGLAATLMMATVGRIAGISGYLARLIPPVTAGDAAQSLLFLGGLVAAVVAWPFATGQPVAHSVTSSPVALVAGGLLVGFGSVVGNGCTSGHGVCGLARFSVRSLAAVVVFMSTAAATVFVARHILGG